MQLMSRNKVSQPSAFNSKSNDIKKGYTRRNFSEALRIKTEIELLRVVRNGKYCNGFFKGSEQGAFLFGKQITASRFE